MKTIITAILILTLAATPALAQNNPPPPEEIGMVGVMGGLLIIGVTIAATIAILKVRSTLPSDNMPVAFVLEKSPDHSTWTPVVTNTVTLNGTNAIEFFRDQIANDTMFYRARKL